MKKKLVSKENRYEENFRITKNELRELFKRIDMKLLNNKLTIDGNNVTIPGDKELHVKMKYEVDKNYAVSFRISWRNEEVVDENMVDEDRNEF